ncbi:hypothetical protein ACIBG8_11780 [Nonomuraea sp. NPDC050556]|uniref:hypothetical protein n=1 Tax=Nonomuraea sp. NPDC050556 TaxID=3364369 RepID=UPI00379F1AEF
MSWERTHRRHELLHAVLDEFARSGRPDRLAAEIEAEFGGWAGFLQEVQLRWFRAFDARLDGVLEEWPADLHGALVRLWQEVAAAMPEHRRVLNAYAGYPALAEPEDRHRRRLLAATGVRLDPIAPVEHRQSRRCWRTLVTASLGGTR